MNPTSSLRNDTRYYRCVRQRSDGEVGIESTEERQGVYTFRNEISKRVWKGETDKGGLIETVNKDQLKMDRMSKVES